MTRVGRVRGRRIAGRVTALALAGVVALASPAAADPAGPSNQRSTVDHTDPAVLTGLRVDVVGNDSFLRVRVAPGHTLLVPGYGADQGEQYVRVAADGTVEENRDSPTWYQNQNRYNPRVPDGITATSPPRWVKVASNGTTLWHDHRIHYMARSRPPVQQQPDGTRLVFVQPVPMVLDGAAVSVYVRLVDIVPPADPTPFVLVAGVVAAVAWFRWPRRPAVAIVLVASTLALVVVLAGHHALPEAAAPRPVDMTLAALAVGATVVAVTRPRSFVAGPLLAGGGVALLVWGWRARSVLSHALLLSGAPGWLQRVSVIAAVTTGLAALGGGVGVTLHPRARSQPREAVPA